MGPHCGFDWHFPNDCDVTHLMCSEAICILSVQKCLFKRFAHFLTKLFVSSLLTYRGFYRSQIQASSKSLPLCCAQPPGMNKRGPAHRQEEPGGAPVRRSPPETHSSGISFSRVWRDSERRGVGAGAVPWVSSSLRAQPQLRLDHRG